MFTDHPLWANHKNKILLCPSHSGTYHMISYFHLKRIIHFTFQVTNGFDIRDFISCSQKSYRERGQGLTAHVPFTGECKLAGPLTLGR